MCRYIPLHFVSKKFLKNVTFYINTSINFFSQTLTQNNSKLIFKTFFRINVI